jgi:quinol monooxygenase YgiN
MKVVSVKFSLKPEFVDRFVEISLGDAKGSVQNEPGCFRFDVFQDEEDPCTVCFYEVYKDDAAFEAHRQMPHYAKWREGFTDEWLAAETQIIRGWSVYPPDEAWSK